MTDETISLSGMFPEASEADWLAGVEKALKVGGLERLTRELSGGQVISPLYREHNFPSAAEPLGAPGQPPFLRGEIAARHRHLPWDIRQRFDHPDPEVTNAEILRDLERGVSSIELIIDPSGANGCAIHDIGDLQTALEGVRADIAPIAISFEGNGIGAAHSEILANWAQSQKKPSSLRLAFNIDPYGTLTRFGPREFKPELRFETAKKTAISVAKRYPRCTTFRVNGCAAHEAGGSVVQELACLIAAGVDLLHRLKDLEWPICNIANRLLFTVSVSANYGVEIAKLRAARRVWARCLEVLGENPRPMRLQAITSRRMLTKYDPWTNMLRGTAACFAASVGGADIISVRAFNEVLSRPEELGRRVARNTQIIAMEESGLGRVVDPAGGAWFTETLAEELAEAAWAEFQKIEGEGGYGTSLADGKLVTRIAAANDARMKKVAHRKLPVTGVSEFPLLEEVEAPVASAPPTGYPYKVGALNPVRTAEPFEALRDRASERSPVIYLATLGPLAEHTARADFARNLFAAGGFAAKKASAPPQSPIMNAAAFKSSGCKIAVICGSDARYSDEAEATASALKEAGAQHVWLAGKGKFSGVDRNIFIGCDVVHELKLAHAELGA